MTTARDIKDALHRRYGGKSQDREGEQYVCIEEARSGAGFQGNDGQCDFLAINTWQSRGLELIGHEVKVSMSDWKAELAQPEKAERFSRFCRRWYIAVPSDLATKIAHEVPPSWGLISVSEKGRCTERQKPTTREPQPVPQWWWVGWLAQIDRQHKRSIPHRIDRLMAEERAATRDRITEEAEARAQRISRGMTDRVERVEKTVENLRDAGLHIDHLYASDIKKIGQLWAASRAGLDLTQVAMHMRQAADKLDLVAGIERDQPSSAA